MYGNFDLDSHKLKWHPREVAGLFNGEWPVVPITVEIGTTSACNQACFFCAYDWTKKAKHLPLVAFQHLLAVTNLRPESVVLSGDGEPTMHPGFEQILEIFNQTDVKLGLMTNGTWDRLPDFLDYFEWVRFSINAGTPERYKNVHGKDHWDQVMENLKACVKAKKETTVGVQCLMLEPSYSDFAQLAQACYNRRVDYLSFKPYSQHPNSVNRVEINYANWNLNLMPPWNWCHVRRQALRQCLIPKQYEHCLAAPFFSLITADGSVYPCAQFVGDREYLIGSIQFQTWESIVCGDRRKKIMDELAHCDVSICRKPCRLDQANEYLYRVQNRQAHDYFL